MKIDHLAIWAENLEELKNFYIKYFDLVSGEKYTNPNKQFTSYFLSFKGDGTRIELMHQPDLTNHGKKGSSIGLAHITISTGSKEMVNRLTERLRADNYLIQSEPRTTGDGYYESVVLDPEGNVVEITE